MDELEALIKHLKMLYRNGRWGTCGSCPTDEHGDLRPERCKNYDRYDHKLTKEALLDQIARIIPD